MTRFWQHDPGKSHKQLGQQHMPVHHFDVSHLHFLLRLSLLCHDVEKEGADDQKKA